MQFVLSAPTRPADTAKRYVRQIDSALIDLEYELATLRRDESVVRARVRTLVDAGQADAARPDCTRIAQLRRQSSVLARYMGVLQETKTSFQIVRTMDQVQQSMRAIGVMTQRINAQFGRVLAGGKLQQEVAAMKTNRDAVEGVLDDVFDGEAASADAILSEFQPAKDTLAEEMLAFKI